MKYLLLDENCNQEKVDGSDLPATAMYHIWIKEGYTPLSVSGSELTDGYSGEYEFTDGMVIDRIN
jgi:hypothetical protein